MTSKTMPVMVSRLGQVLSGHQWGEHHSGTVDASVDQVWVALHQLRWSDLGWLRPVVALRGITAMVGADTPMLQTFTSHGAVAHEEPPSMTMFAWSASHGRWCRSHGGSTPLTRCRPSTSPGG